MMSKQVADLLFQAIMPPASGGRTHTASMAVLP